MLAILLGSPVRSEEALALYFLTFVARKTPLKCEVKHTFTHPENLEMTIVYLMVWFYCVDYISFE